MSKSWESGGQGFCEGGGFVPDEGQPTRSSIPDLKILSAKNCEAYGKADSTRKTYKGYLDRGKAFLAQCVAERRVNGEDVMTDGINNKLLELAFEKPPNAYSVEALASFLSEKCFRQGCSRSTAELIQSAFTDYWDNM